MRVIFLFICGLILCDYGAEAKGGSGGSRGSRSSKVSRRSKARRVQRKSTPSHGTTIMQPTVPIIKEKVWKRIHPKGSKTDENQKAIHYKGIFDGIYKIIRSAEIGQKGNASTEREKRKVKIFRSKADDIFRAANQKLPRNSKGFALSFVLNAIRAVAKRRKANAAAVGATTDYIVHWHRVLKIDSSR